VVLPSEFSGNDAVLRDLLVADAARKVDE
jgi:hypothetical protein